MRSQLVEADLQVFHIVGGVVAFQNSIADGFLFCFLLNRLLSNRSLYSRSRFRSVRYHLASVNQPGAAFQ